MTANLLINDPSEGSSAVVTCPVCGEQGTYWEDRVPVHDSIAGFEIRAAGIEHPDGRLCTDSEL